MASLAALVTLVSVVGIYVQQQGKAQQQAAELADPASPSGLVLASQATGTALASVGKVTGLALPCTAWLLNTGAAGDARAVAVTSGRCAGITDSSQVLAGRDVADARIDFEAFAPLTTAVQPMPVRSSIERVLWASSRWTDLALLELTSTYGELQSAGVEPIAPMRTPPQDTTVLVAGVPVQDIAGDQRYVRASRCVVGATVDVVEGPWVFSDARATDCTGIRGGSTGSPIFDPAGNAVGMVVSTTIAAQTPDACGVGAPCEIGADQVTSRPNTTYVLPVAGLSQCWASGQLALGEQCPLEDPAGVVAATPAEPAAAPGTSVPVEVDRNADGPARIAAKQGALGAVDCAEPADWSDPVPADDWELELSVPQTGWAIACVGSAAQPTPVLVRANAAAATAG